MPTAYGLPNCVGWYVANRGVYADAGATAATNGAAVAQWNDVSGSNNHLTQATAGNRPVFNTYAANATAAGTATLGAFGVPTNLDQPSLAKSVLFDGSTSFLNLPDTLGLTADGCTAVLCTRGAYHAPLSLGTDGVHSFSYGSVGIAPQRMGLFNGAVQPVPASTYLPQLVRVVHGFRCSASLNESRVYIGTNQQSAIAGNVCNAPLTGGAVGRSLNVDDATLGNRAFAGEVYELALFNQPLSDAAMAQLLANMQAANRLRADANANQLIFIGDSLTTGGPGIVPISQCYPWALCQQFGGAFKPLLLAAPGQTVAQQQAMVNQQVLPLDRVPFERNVAIVCCGSDDLAAGAAVNDVVAGLATLCNGLRTNGYTAVVATITPRSDIGISQQAGIAATNASLRSGHTAYADTLVDWAADPRLTDPTDATYYADGWHTNDAGDGVKATLVKAVLDPILAPSNLTTTQQSAPFYTGGQPFTGAFGHFVRA